MQHRAGSVAGPADADIRLDETLASKSWDPDFVRRAAYAVVALAEEGRADPATVIPALEDACARLPRSTECAQTLGRAQLLAGHADEAAATLRDALDYAPTNTETHRLLAEAEAAAGG